MTTTYRSRQYRHGFAFLIGLLALLLALPGRASGQAVHDDEAAGLTAFAGQMTTEPVPLTLDEAIQIALVRNYALQLNKLDVENAGAQAREAWGQVLPQVDFSSSYTRNLKSANPFAGSDAGSLFGSLGAIDWLAFNERARTDDDAVTAPISLAEFQQRQGDGYAAAGAVLGGSDNPFAVPNQFAGGVTISQKLFDARALAGIKGAGLFTEVSRLAADRQAQQVVDQAREAYYQALLTQAQTHIVAGSVARTRETVGELATQVAQGTVPKYQRLSAEVELANLETQFSQAENQAALALDNLKLTLGIPVGQPITLRDELRIDDDFLLTTISAGDAMGAALAHRPDLEQALKAIELQQIQKSATKADYFPSLSGFASLNYTGNVPDNRTRIIGDPSDPFTFSTQTNGVFSDGYWDPSINVGVRLSWTLFNGGQTRARAQQNQIAIDRAHIQHEQLAQTIRLEVESALRNLRTARQQILGQDQNVARAELNYTYAETRLREGVSSQLELREASQQLDQSRMSRLQAVYDYLVAQSALETALGRSPAASSDFRLTSN